MAVGEVLLVENENPGFTAQAIATESSWINGRLRKRYGRHSGRANSLPLGQSPPLLLATGTNPPALMLNGTPILGSLQIGVTITTGGVVGVAVFKYTIDGGVTYTTNVTSAAQVPLAGTGMVLQMPTAAGNTFSTDNVYAAATPVPEIVLSWLTTLVTHKLMRKRGMNPQDPIIELLVADVQRVHDEIKEAADSKDGLFDLPTSEDEDSAVTTGGPAGCSQTSPYVWQDVERAIGVAQDAQSLGVNVPFGGNPFGDA